MRNRISFLRSPENWARGSGTQTALQDARVEEQHQNGGPIGEERQRFDWRNVWTAAQTIPQPGLWAALAIGLWVRLTFVVGEGFPLNDGGLFHTMALDIQRAAFALPAFTTYNQADIPFAYPPFGLYLAAITEAITPLSMLDVTRFLPLVFNVLTIGAVYFLARAMLGSLAAATIAAIAFALLPRSYTWLIVGGGLTRSPALLFAVLGIWAIYLFYTRRQWRYLAPATGFAGLALLTHPEVGWFAIFSYMLFFLFYGLHWRGVSGSAIAAIGTLAITAPWWGTVIGRHGVEPLLAAASTGGHDIIPDVVRSLRYFRFTEEPYGTLLAVTGVLGVFAALARSLFVLPVWFMAIFVLEPRSAHTYAMIPLAMFIGLFVAVVLVPGLWRAARPSGRPVLLAGASDGWPRARHLARLWAPAGSVFLLLAFLGTYAGLSAVSANENILRALPPGDRTAMEWVAENTPEDSRFLVMTYTHWPNDHAGEWFPVLTGRHSIATVQGTEWLPNDLFEWRQARFYQLIGCSHQGVECVQTWLEGEPQQYDYIYLSQGCCGADLINGLQESAEHQLVYGTRAVGIWQYVPAEPAPEQEGAVMPEGFVPDDPVGHASESTHWQAPSLR